MTDAQEYVVYNRNTGNIITQPAPHETAKRICAAFNDDGKARYALHSVDGFDYDTMIDGALKDDLVRWAGWDIAGYERQWSVDLTAWANGPALPALMVAWFAVQVVIAMVLA